MKFMESLDVSKSLRPDEIINWIIKKYSEKLTDEAHSVIEMLLAEGKIPL